jgi:hypothetical protein
MVVPFRSRLCARHKETNDPGCVSGDLWDVVCTSHINFHTTLHGNDRATGLSLGLAVYVDYCPLAHEI